MTLYKFFSAEGTQGKFVVANKEIRSHAMKNVKHRMLGRSNVPRNMRSQHASEEIVRRKEELRCRFRLASGMKATAKSNANRGNKSVVMHMK